MKKWIRAFFSHGGKVNMSSGKSAICLNERVSTKNVIMTYLMCRIEKSEKGAKEEPHHFQQTFMHRSGGQTWTLAARTVDEGYYYDSFIFV